MYRGQFVAMVLMKGLLGAVLGGGIGVIAALVLFLPVWLVAGIVTNSERAAERIAGNVGGWIVILGAAIGLIRAQLEEVKESRVKALAREADAPATAPADTRPVLDLVLLDRAYDQHRLSAKHVDYEYLNDVVVPALSGRPVGVNEFEQREFEKNRAARIAQIKNTALHFRVGSAYGGILEYDFDRKRFPVYAAFHVKRYSRLYVRCDGYRPHKDSSTYHDAILPIPNVDQAKQVRQRGEFVAALMVATPIDARRHSNERIIVVKVLGLRLLVEKGDEPLLRNVAIA